MTSIDAQIEEKMLYFKNSEQVQRNIDVELQWLYEQRDKSTNLNDRLKFEEKCYELEKKKHEIENDSIDSFFFKVMPIFQQLSEEPTSDDNTCINKGELFNFFSMTLNGNKGQILSQYMQEIENSPPTPQKVEFEYVCKNCNTVKKISQVDSLIICETCGDDESYYDIGTQGLTYEQEINTDTNVHFAYKRINHFKELLCQLQAKESSNIPCDVIHKLQYEFKKQRITNTDDITLEKVKFHLKKLKLNKYYENAYQITNILTGKPPPTLSNELYERLIVMFLEIQDPFEEACPSHRKNFLSYNYVLYKFCELLNENEFIHYFTLLKSREKLYQQDCIWKKICEILDWKFISSV